MPILSLEKGFYVSPKRGVTFGFAGGTKFPQVKITLMIPVVHSIAIYDKYVICLSPMLDDFQMFPFSSS